MGNFEMDAVCARECRAEYEELKKAKEKAEEDTIFSFKKKKGCQAERRQARQIARSLRR